MLKRTRTTNSEAIVNELELSKQLVDYSLIEGTILRQKYANYFQNFDYNNDYINSVNEASKKINIDDKLINEKFIVQFIPYEKRQNKIIAKYKGIVKWFEIMIGVLSLLAIIISQIEYETIYYKNFYPCTVGDAYTKDYKGTSYRIVNILISFCICVLNMICDFLKHKIQLEQKILSNKSFFCSEYFAYMLINIVISLITPIPYIEKCISIKNGKYSINYNISTFFYALSLLKTIFVLRTIFTLSKFTSSLAEKNCHESGCEATASFAAKCLQKDNPALFISIVVSTAVVIIGFLIRFFELPNTESINDYSFYTNSFWNVIVIMTTVGYGDFYPSTRIGHVIVVIAIFCGNLLTSLIIVSLTNASEFSSEENKAFLVINRMKLRKELINKCQRIIKLNYQLKIIRSEISYTEALKDKKYNALYRELLSINQDRLKIEKELKRDSFVSQEEKLENVNKRIEEDLIIIKNSITMLNQMKHKITIMTQMQSKMYRNLKHIKTIYSSFIKCMMYSTFSNEAHNDINNTSNSILSKIKETISQYKKENAIDIDSNIDIIGDELRKMENVHNKRYLFFSQIITDNINHLRMKHNLTPIKPANSSNQLLSFKNISIAALTKRMMTYNLLMNTARMVNTNKNEQITEKNEDSESQSESDDDEDEKSKSEISLSVSDRSGSKLINLPKTNINNIIFHNYK